MFTGIVQGLGEVVSLERKHSEMRLGFRLQFEMRGITDGESIAINGVCLSVEKHAGQEFMAYASEQTLRHSNLGQLKTGSLVNLERSIAFGERLGGHLVTGHVDCVATVKNIEKASESRLVTVTFPPSFSDAVIDRGSITLDGISLTVTACGSGFLSVNIIPDSQKRTNMRFWRPGGNLNMETDLIGKYVANLARIWFSDQKQETRKDLSRDFLSRHGFI